TTISQYACWASTHNLFLTFVKFISRVGIVSLALIARALLLLVAHAIPCESSTCSSSIAVVVAVVVDARAFARWRRRGASLRGYSGARCLDLLMKLDGLLASLLLHRRLLGRFGLLGGGALGAFFRRNQIRLMRRRRRRRSLSLFKLLFSSRRRCCHSHFVIMI